MVRTKFSGWIYYAAKRFSLVDKKGAGAFTSRLSALGICFGVMTLIVVISVMNGFQGEFIDAIMEVSSFHARVQSDGQNKDIIRFLESGQRVVLAQEFFETESLAVSAGGKQSALLVRGVDADIMARDKGFERELKIVRGKFDLNSFARGKDGQDLCPIVLGSALARALGTKVGGEVSLYAVSSNRPLMDVFSAPKTFVVRGIFTTGYADINSSYAFVEKSAAKDFFDQSPLIVGVKLKNPDSDALVQKELAKFFPNADFQSWRDYNRSFFGALKVEKNMLMLLVVLIFLVVAINIFMFF